MPAKSPLYDRDFFAWSREQAELLRAGKLEQADIEHIAEEIDSMGRTEKRELISRLSVLLLHLLKWRYQSEKRGPSWEASIRVQRNRLAEHLGRQPEPQAAPAPGASLRLSRRGAGGGRGDGAGWGDISWRRVRGRSRGVGRRVLAELTWGLLCETIARKSLLSWRPSTVCVNGFQMIQPSCKAMIEQTLP